MEKYFCQYNTNENTIFNYGHTINYLPPHMPIHIHDHYELYYFISGDVTYYIEGQAYKLESNDILIINNRELHRPVFDSDQPYERITIHFAPDYVSAFQTKDYDLLYFYEKRKLGHFNRVDAKDVLKYQVDQCLLEMEKHIHENTAEKHIMVKTTFVRLLVTLNKIFSNKKKILVETFEYDPKIVSILDYINNHLDEKITLDLLEETFFVNKYYLCHIFKKNTGFTVMEYVTYKRIMKAKELLSMHTPVIETCHAVGFNDYSNFYKVFKRIVGTSPRDFIK